MTAIMIDKEFVMDEFENIEESVDESADVPVCLGCMEPVDPGAYYCDKCGEASNQLTQYLPFVNIRWQVDVWGRMWRQVRSGEGSIWSRLFRLLVIIWNVPIMLLGLIFMRKPKVDIRDDGAPEEDENWQ
jgi:hypothetical protein